MHVGGTTPTAKAVEMLNLERSSKNATKTALQIEITDDLKSKATKDGSTKAKEALVGLSGIFVLERLDDFSDPDELKEIEHEPETISSNVELLVNMQKETENDDPNSFNKQYVPLSDIVTTIGRLTHDDSFSKRTVLANSIKVKFTVDDEEDVLGNEVLLKKTTERALVAEVRDELTDRMFPGVGRRGRSINFTSEWITVARSAGFPMKRARVDLVGFWDKRLLLMGEFRKKVDSTGVKTQMKYIDNDISVDLRAFSHAIAMMESFDKYYIVSLHGVFEEAYVRLIEAESNDEGIVSVRYVPWDEVSEVSGLIEGDIADGYDILSKVLLSERFAKQSSIDLVPIGMDSVSGTKHDNLNQFCEAVVNVSMTKNFVCSSVGDLLEEKPVEHPLLFANEALALYELSNVDSRYTPEVIFKKSHWILKRPWIEGDILNASISHTLRKIWNCEKSHQEKVKIIIKYFKATLNYLLAEWGNLCEKRQIVHQDVHFSNILVVQKKFMFIDFGLIESLKNGRKVNSLDTKQLKTGLNKSKDNILKVIEKLKNTTQDTLSARDMDKISEKWDNTLKKVIEKVESYLKGKNKFLNVIIPKNQQ